MSLTERLLQAISKPIRNKNTGGTTLLNQQASVILRKREEEGLRVEYLNI